MRAKQHPKAFVGVVIATLAALAVAGCGSSSSSSHSSSPTTTAAASASGAATTAAAKPSRPLRLHIVSPRAGAHTGQNLTVRVALTGTASGHVHSFRYVLDGALTRHGNARLTLHGLAPGRQHLVVSVPGDPRLHAAAIFVVRTPPVPVAPASAASSAPTSTTPVPAPTAPAPTTAAPATTTPAPAPATTTSAAPAPAPPAPAPASGITQGNGGDMDGDNNGGPSDGDGGV